MDSMGEKHKITLGERTKDDPDDGNLNLATIQWRSRPEVTTEMGKDGTVDAGLWTRSRVA